MEKTSKVKSQKFQKEYEGNYGKVYYFEIEMENGDKGQYGSKKNPQDTFIEGQELSYDIVEKNGYFHIKPLRQIIPNGFNGNKKPYDPAADNFRQALIVAQSSITKVVELVIAGKVEMKDLQPVTDRLMQIQFDLAKKFQSEVNKPLEV